MRPARRARRPHEAAQPPGEAALARVLASRRCVVFTGAGFSASAGMSAFSDDNGLYERARKRYKLDTGVRMFYGSFFTSRPRDCQAFLADVYAEACSAAPTEAHASLARLQRLGVVTRHVTLNVDGLHRSCDDGRKTTTELHGCVRDAVCRTCGSVTPMTPRLAALFRSVAASNPQCGACTSGGLLRPRVLLYNDPEQHLVIPGDVELSLIHI
jgi:NAD-dependent SIR2 family protein deacetylase